MVKAKELCQKREEYRCKSVDPQYWNCNGPVTRSKSPHVGLWDPIPDSYREKTAFPKRRKSCCEEPKKTSLDKLDVQAVEQDAVQQEEEECEPQMIKLGDFKKILEKKKTKRRKSCAEQFDRLFGDTQIDEMDATMQKHKRKGNIAATPTKNKSDSDAITKNKSSVVVATPTKNKSDSEPTMKNKSSIAVAIPTKNKSDTEPTMKNKSNVVATNKRDSDASVKNKSNVTSQKYKYKNVDVARKRIKTTHHDDSYHKKQKKVDKLDSEVPPKKKKQIVTEDNLDILFPTASVNSNETITLNGNTEAVLLSDNKHLKVHQAVISTIDEIMLERCSSIELPRLVDNRAQMSTNESLTIATNNPRPIVLRMQETIIDLTHVKKEEETIEETNLTPTRLRINIESFIMNIAPIVFSAMFDRHICRFIARTYMTYFPDSKLEEEVRPYREANKKKLERASQQLLSSLMNIEDVADFNVGDMLKATSEYIQRHMGSKKCDRKVIFDVLDGVMTLIPNKNATPFLEKFVREMEMEKMKRMEATGIQLFWWEFSIFKIV